MNENRLKEYIKSGGEIFYIKSIDVLRDGGTIVLNTNSKTCFYIHKTEKTLHSSNPCDSNLIDDKLLIEYVYSQIEIFVTNQESELSRNKKLLNDIQKLA